MKKLLIIILFLFLLSGCQKKTEFILGVSKIDEHKVCEEYCVMDLKIITSQSLENIYVDSINSPAAFDYQVKNSKETVKFEEDLQGLYTYDLMVRVFEPTNIEKIDLEINQKIYSFNIGKFTCLRKDNPSNNLTHLNYEVSANQELNSDIVYHKIKFINQTEEAILIGDIKVLNENIQVCRNIKDKYIPKEEAKTMVNCFIEKEMDVYKMNYILEVNYVYNGKIYYTYFNIQDTALLKETTSSNSIIVDKSCFVLKD